jgi:hypothetical protein
MGINIEVHLRKNGKPNVVWTNGKVLMCVVGFPDGVHKAILRWRDVGIFESGWRDKGLDNAAAFSGLNRTNLPKKVFNLFSPQFTPHALEGWSTTLNMAGVMDDAVVRHYNEL